MPLIARSVILFKTPVPARPGLLFYFIYFLKNVEILTTTTSWYWKVFHFRHTHKKDVHVRQRQLSSLLSVRVKMYRGWEPCLVLVLQCGLGVSGPLEKPEKSKLNSWGLYGCDIHKAVENSCQRLKWWEHSLDLTAAVTDHWEQSATQQGRGDRERQSKRQREGEKVHGRGFTEHSSQMRLHRWHPPSRAYTTNKPSWPLCVYVTQSYSAAHSRGSLLEGSSRIMHNYSESLSVFSA